MKLPNNTRFTVKLPSGIEMPVAVLHMTRDGTVTRIDTVAIDHDNPLSSGWYTIEGEDLERVQLWMRYSER